MTVIIKSGSAESRKLNGREYKLDVVPNVGDFINVPTDSDYNEAENFRVFSRTVDMYNRWVELQVR